MTTHPEMAPYDEDEYPDHEKWIDRHAPSRIWESRLFWAFVVAGLCAAYFGMHFALGGL